MEKQQKRQGKQQIETDISNLIKGFGDLKEPNAEVVSAVYKCLLDFMQCVLQRAKQHNASNKLTHQDVMFVLR